MAATGEPQQGAANDVAIAAGSTAPALIDVLIPVYNAADTVAQAVLTIQAQTIRDIRILLINDGSTDGSLKVMQGIAGRDDRVTVLDKENSGVVDALNLGLAHCTAEVIARHDADDLASPDRFERQLAYLTGNPDCVAVSSFARHIDISGNATGSLAQFRLVDRADATWVPSREPYLLHPFLMVRRSALVAIGGYRYAHHAEDTDLYWRLQSVGRLHIIEEVMGAYRFSAQSITSRSALNGRLSAINSQLAAVSEARRRDGRIDLAFEKRTADEMADAGSTQGIYDIARRQLHESEARYLRAAYAAKLLELTSYRPYELDLADCLFVAAALDAAEPHLKPQNLKETRRLRATAAARLIRTGYPRCFVALASRGIAVEMTWRLAAQVAVRFLPSGTRRSVRAFQASHGLT